MRIGVDIRCLMEAKYSGISEVTYNLLKHLLKFDHTNQYILFYNSAKAIKVPEFNFPNVEVKEFKYPNKLFNLSLRLLKVAEIDKLIGGVDMFFMPNFLFINLSSSCRKVLLVHDLSFELYPEFFTWKKRLWHSLIGPKQMCQSADQIIAISQNTKRDIVSLYSIASEKITVIPNGINEVFFQPISQPEKDRVKKKYSLPDNFLLSLGNLEPRKNLESLITAFSSINSRFDLVIAGGEAWKFKKLYKKAHRLLTQERIKFLGYVDQADKPALYSLANVFVYPSMYEGFGLPPLEAMACGAPVVCSNSSSLPEAVSNAALMVDPYNTQSIAQAIEQIINDKSLADEFSRRGIQQAQKYRWDAIAQQFLSVFNQAK